MSGAAQLLADASAWQARGELGPAERLGRAALALEPGNVEALQLLGLALRARGELLDEAATLLRRAAALRPGDPDLLNNLGSTLVPAGESEAAIEALRRAIALRPGMARFHSNLGNALAAAGRDEEAEAEFRRALALDAGLAAARRGLALLLHGRKAHAEAAEHWRALLAAQPQDAQAARSLLSCLLVLGEFAEAVAIGRRAVALAEDASGVSDLATALHHVGEHADALTLYDRALVLEPGRPEAHFNRGLLLLSQGVLGEGFAEHEHRFGVPGREAPAIGLPFWEGEPLAGRCVLVFPEQGLGDMLQFLRFVPRLAEAGAAVRLDVPEAMLRAMAPLGGAALRVRGGERVDFKVSVMSLAHRLGVSEAGLGAGVPYLAAEPALVARWRERIGMHGFRVGICWQGNPSVGWDASRSIPLAHFLPLGRIPGVRLVSLQQRYGLDQLAAMPPGAVETLWDRFPQEPDLLVDTFAVMQCLDLIVTSDTSVAHMAGALGRPVFLALRHVPDWRWMLGRADSPWYPSMRLFRQPVPGDWKSVFAAIARAVRRRVRASAAGA